jgi:hypothetical protein
MTTFESVSEQLHPQSASVFYATEEAMKNIVASDEIATRNKVIAVVAVAAGVAAGVAYFAARSRLKTRVADLMKKTVTTTAESV